MKHLFAPDSPWLAPLAGYSDIAFRLLCRKYGAHVACTEMVSAKGLLYESIGTQDLLRTEEKDSPLVVQLFGREPEILATVMKTLQAEGFRYFDLNIGCSVPKVVKTGCGVALMRDIHTLEHVAKTMVSVAKEGHVGFKIRLGWNTQEENYLDIATMLASVGAGWITLHPRYAKQGYSGVAQWEKIKHLVHSVDIPIIASGDIFSAKDALRCMEISEASTVMFARGAMNNPCVFEEYIANIRGEVYIPRDMRRVAIEHIEYMQQYILERRAVVRMRSSLPKYLKQCCNSKILRSEIIKAQSFSDIQSLISSL